MSISADKNTIMILGCFHADSNTAPRYAEKLKATIIELKPRILCVELSPEQLGNVLPHGAKKEYADVILPLASEFKIAVVPIDPPGSVAEPMIREKHRAERELQEDHIGNIRIKLMDKFTEIIAARWYAALEESDCFDYVQAREFDILHYEPWYAMEEQYSPATARIWNEWNAYLADRIGETIDKYPGDRILVTVGLDHKYWLWNRLKERKDIILHDLQSFRAAQAGGGNNATPSG